MNRIDSRSPLLHCPFTLLDFSFHRRRLRRHSLLQKSPICATAGVMEISAETAQIGGYRAPSATSADDGGRLLREGHGDAERRFRAAHMCARGCSGCAQIVLLFVPATEPVYNLKPTFAVIPLKGIAETTCIAVTYGQQFL
jgi:hypothetical protein